MALMTLHCGYNGGQGATEVQGVLPHPAAPRLSGLQRAGRCCFYREGRVGYTCPSHTRLLRLLPPGQLPTLAPRWFLGWGGGWGRWNRRSRQNRESRLQEQLPGQRPPWARIQDDRPALAAP